MANPSEFNRSEASYDVPLMASLANRGVGQIARMDPEQLANAKEQFGAFVTEMTQAMQAKEGYFDAVAKAEEGLIDALGEEAASIALSGEQDRDNKKAGGNRVDREQIAQRRKTIDMYLFENGAATSVAVKGAISELLDEDAETAGRSWSAYYTNRSRSGLLVRVKSDTDDLGNIGTYDLSKEYRVKLQEEIDSQEEEAWNDRDSQAEDPDGEDA